MSDSRENLFALLDHGSPQRMPFTLDIGAIPGFTRPIMQQFVERTGANDPAEYFNYDFRTFSLKAIFSGEDPRTWHDDVEPGTTFDEWGIGHSPCEVQGAVGRTYPPLAGAKSLSDVEAYPSPALDTTIDLSPIAAYKNRGYPVFGYAGSIYEWSWWLRGMETFLADTILDPALTEAIIAKVADYTRQLALASAAAGIDVLCFYDDVGTQTGMQISPEMWRRFIKPRWRTVLEDIRSRFPNVRMFLHSCGCIRDIIPDVVDLGFDILHPIQPECMDFAEVHRQFSAQITLCATISSQRIFPFGTPDEVRQTVQQLKGICGKDHRGILCPSNMLQPETPWENIVAFVEAART
jgi:uroporphyrinogen decarboxylase